MNSKQAEQLLILASRGDNRIVSDMLIEEWGELLGNLEYSDLVDALREHRLTAPGVYLEAGHLFQILQKRKTSRGMLQLGPPDCPIHDHYPIDRASGLCDQCIRHPEDRATGVKPPTRSLGELLLNVGREIPQEK